jgi:membrane associated rhomboid family serine protease
VIARSRRQPARVPVWPAVLILIGLASLIVFALQLLGGDNDTTWLDRMAFIPARVMSILAEPWVYWFQADALRLITALFLHLDWLHLIGNLAYLWVFGITVERAVGHWRFLFLFIILGGLANAVVAWQLADSVRPVIGASGGVSAIIGVYLGLFPTRRMGLWLPLGLYLQFAHVPALLVIGSWFVVQLLFSVFGPISGDVAWWSHIAGFLFGFAAALVLRLIPGQVNLALRED